MRTIKQVEGWSRVKKYFNFSGSFRDVTLDMSFIDQNEENMFILPAPTVGTNMRQISTNIALDYKKKISDLIAFDGKFSYAQCKLRSNYDMLNKDFYGIQQHESNAFELELTSFMDPCSDVEITLGLYQRTITNAYNNYDIPSLDRSVTNPTLINNYIYLSDDDQIIKRAFYSQIDYLLLNDLKIIAGVRLEQMPNYKIKRVLAGGTQYSSRSEAVYDADNIDFIPRLAVLYSLNNQNIIKFLYGKAINRPSFLQNAISSFDKLHGNLQPEDINTIELNYISNFFSKITINLNVFHNTLNNLITRMVEITTTGGYKTWTANAG